MLITDISCNKDNFMSDASLLYLRFDCTLGHVAVLKASNSHHKKAHALASSNESREAVHISLSRYNLNSRSINICSA